MADAWWQHKGGSVDLRNPMGPTSGYSVNNVGVAALPAGSTVTCTTGGVGTGVITISIPVTSFGNGGRISQPMVVTRLLSQTDVARYSGESVPITNMPAADACDDASVYYPLAVWDP